MDNQVNKGIVLAAMWRLGIQESCWIIMWLAIQTKHCFGLFKLTILCYYGTYRILKPIELGDTFIAMTYILGFAAIFILFRKIRYCIPLFASLNPILRFSRIAL